MENQKEEKAKIEDVIKCPWCKSPSPNPQDWLYLRSRVLHVCAPCADSIRSGLGILQFLARELGTKLRSRKA